MKAQRAKLDEFNRSILEIVNFKNEFTTYMDLKIKKYVILHIA